MTAVINRIYMLNDWRASLKEKKLDVVRNAAGVMEILLTEIQAEERGVGAVITDESHF